MLGLSSFPRDGRPDPARASVRCGLYARSSRLTPSFASASSTAEASFGNRSSACTPTQKTRAAFEVGKKPMPENEISTALDFTPGSASFNSSSRGSGNSHMNFNVRCKACGFIQRTSGANPATPSTKRTIFCRIGSSRSMATKSRMATSTSAGSCLAPAGLPTSARGRARWENFVSPLRSSCRRRWRDRQAQSVFPAFRRSARRFR